MDKILDTGVEVLKIEGRARAPEYVKTVVGAYRQGVEAVQNGTFTEEVANQLEDRLSTVFNRGFWGGYYQGAKIGEWSKVYGSQATERKTYVAKITNYFPKISVAEVLPEAAPVHVGDKILIIGPTTGVIEHTITEIRVDLKPVEMAPQGQICSIPIPERLRRSDKIFRVDHI